MSNVRHLMKRRATLQAGLAAGIAAATFPSAAASKRTQDTRLMGVWRSDRDRTVDMWRFKPGLKDGRPVSVSAQIEVNFRLL